MTGETFDWHSLLQRSANQSRRAAMEGDCSKSAADVSFALFILIILAGSVGNIVCFIVVLSKGKKTATNFLLAVLVFTDIVYLLLYMAKNTLAFHLQKASGLTVEVLERQTFWRVVLDEIHRVVQLISVWMVVLLAGLRSIAVRNPYFAIQYCTKRNVVLALFGIIIISTAVHLPFTIIWISLACDALLHKTCLLAIDHRDEKISDFTQYYQYICYNVFLIFVIPCIFVSVFSVILIRDLRRRHSGLLEVRNSDIPSRTSSTLSQRSRRDSSDVTKLVLATVLIFLVTYSCQFITGIYTVLQDAAIAHLPPCFESGMFHVIYIVSSLNASVHFATNFIFRQYFRNSCRLLCGCHVTSINAPRQQNQSFINSTTSMRIHSNHLQFS
jgi:hypothetical protein